MSSKVKTVKFFDPGLSYQMLRPEIDLEMQRVLSSGDLILREDVERFEKTLADFVGTKYAVGLNSGTDALYLALKAAGIGKGDTVAVPSHTFVATAQVVVQVGAEPLLVDLYDMDLNFEFYMPCKAIMPAHIAGDFCADMRSLIAEAKERGMLVIEDACQALGAEQHGKKAGAWGDMGAFSFYPAKILGAYGDAGALVTDNEEYANEVRELRNHYKKDYSKWGINSRLDNLQAAVLNVKFKYLSQTLARREAIALHYLEELEDVLIFTPNPSPGRVWQDFIIETDKRDELYDFLKEQGIETMKNEYPMPIAKKILAGSFEVHSLRLPINEVLTDEEIDYVIIKIKEFYGA